jgi:quercetin dioxygenase-like cupin family protein
MSAAVPAPVNALRSWLISSGHVGFSAAAIVSAALVTSSASVHAGDIPAQAESVAPRLHTAIPNLSGTSFTSAIVSFPPGAKALPHRHGEAFVYAYVLSGTIRSRLDDQPAKVYHPGEDWYEAPGARHRVTENLSKTRPARLLVVFVAPDGAALKVPE